MIVHGHIRPEISSDLKGWRFWIRSFRRHRCGLCSDSWERRYYLYHLRFARRPLTISIFLFRLRKGPGLYSEVRFASQPGPWVTRKHFQVSFRQFIDPLHLHTAQQRQSQYRLTVAEEKFLLFPKAVYKKLGQYIDLLESCQHIFKRLRRLLITGNPWVRCPQCLEPRRSCIQAISKLLMWYHSILPEAIKFPWNSSQATVFLLLSFLPHSAEACLEKRRGTTRLRKIP